MLRAVIRKWRLTLLQSSIRPLRHCVKRMIWPPAAGDSATCTSSRCSRASVRAFAQEAARTRSEQAALMVQRRANDAQLTANLSRRQAESAQIQATAAQRQAEEAQRLASSMQLRADAYAPPAYDYRRRQNERAVRGECDLRPCRGRSAAATLLGGSRAGGDRFLRRQHSRRNRRRRDRRHPRPPDWRRPWAGSRYGYRSRRWCSGWRKRWPRLGRSGLHARTCSDANTYQLQRAWTIGMLHTTSVAMSIACK